MLSWCWPYLSLCQFVLYFDGTEYHCPGRLTTTTFSDAISVECTFAKYPNDNEIFGNRIPNEFENEYENENNFDLHFIVKNPWFLCVIRCVEHEFAAQKEIDWTACNIL